MDPERYRNAFIANHSRLVRKLTSSELVETAFTHGLISPSEKEEVEAERTEFQRVSKCLSIFHRRYYGNQNVYDELLKVIEEINDNEGGIIDHVITSLNESIKNPPEFPNSASLSEFDRSRLQLNEATIVSTLDVLQLLPDFISEGVVSFLEADILQEESSFTKRGERIVTLLKQKGSYVYERFIEILRDSEVYEQLANSLSSSDEEQRTKMDDAKYVEQVLKDGHVPPLPPNYIRRADMIKTIRKHLRKLRDSDSWVVIYGLPGFGKTVLSIDSVRQASLLREVFPGGVVWLSVGKMKDSNGQLNTDALLEKVQNLILRMDKNKYRPPNLESATDYLQSVMSEQHPRSLLILDDLWEPETAQAFSVRCRTLVTTRNIVIAESVATNNVYKVSVMEGFTHEEGLELLSKHVGTELPPEANDIIKLSYGSPIVLDIIGASLPKALSSGRWKVAVDRLKIQHPGGLVMKAGASPYLQSRRPSEQKRGRTKSTLNTSISLTEESLPSDIRDYFRWLVVFEEHTNIKPETLATIWDMNKYDADDIMQEIVSWSLAKQAQIHFNNEDSDSLQSYTVHDMILDYLKDTIDSTKQIQYHRELVESYQKKCNGQFSSLEPDGYVHNKLLSHIYAADMKDLLAALLSDLLWLDACVRYWDCNSLLGAYKKYKTILPEQSIGVVNELQLFLSSNLDLLSTKPSLCDVVQLALTTLQSDNLVKQARQEVQKDKDNMYLIWNNRAAAKRPEATLKLQPHKNNEVKYCQYYDKGTKVVSCSTDTIKLWVAATGEELESFQGHDDQMTHCTISENGTLLISTSDDATCNVWDVLQRKLLLKFIGHLDGVQCCALSHDSKTVVSVDIMTHAIVWSCDKANMGTIISQWDHGDGGLTSCAFLKTGKEIVVANQDSLVKLYSIHGATLGSFPVVATSLSFSQNGLVDQPSSRPPSRSLSCNSGSGFSVRSCVVSDNGHLLAAGIGDCTARVWSIESFELLHTFPHSSDVLSVDFSPDSNLLLTGSVSGIIKVWSLSQRCPILELPLHYDWVMCVKFSPTGSHVLSTSFHDGIIKVIPLETNSQTWKLYKRRFSVNFKMNIDRTYTPTIVCYDIKSKSLEVCKGLNASTESVLATRKGFIPRSWQISPNGKLVVVGYNEGLLQLFDISSGDILWTKDDAHNGEIPHCYFSPDGTKLVSCGDIHQVWSVENGERLSYQKDCQDFYVKPCVFYNDSSKIASAIKPGKILVWSTTDQNETLDCDDISSSEDQMSILCVNISGDDSKLVASAVNGFVAVWNASNGQKVFSGSFVAPGGDSQARFCSLDYRGVLVAVGHDDSTLKIYNVDNGHEVTCPNNFSGGWMISTQFSPNNQQIITLSKSIQWWSRDGKLLKQFILKSIFGKYLYFSPDFKSFITIDNTGLLYVLSVL